MRNDSIETLLLRHYGSTAPAGLEEQLQASVRRRAAELHKQEQSAAGWLQRRVSRRQLLRVVTIGTAGVGLLSAGLEKLMASDPESREPGGSTTNIRRALVSL